jgi:membrane fusion protein, heavy metal efflux system
VPGARTHLRVALIAAGLLAASALPGCGASRAAATATVPPARGAGTSPPADTLELSPEQLSAIRIEPVGTWRFAVERQAVGSLSFEEDPAIVAAESTLVGAAATEQLTRKERARVEALGERSGIAQKELEQAISDQQTAAAALRAARDALRALGVSDARIEAMVHTGRIEAASGARRHEKWVLAAVSESDSPFVEVGQPVAVTVLARPGRVYTGRVARVYATVDPQMHRVAVRALLADPGDMLRPGMLADVTIRTTAPVESLALPTAAVVREGDGSMIVWLTTDRRTFRPQPLRLGLESAGHYQVLAGLEPGELAVTEGGVFLSNLLHAPPGD